MNNINLEYGKNFIYCIDYDVDYDWEMKNITGKKVRQVYMSLFHHEIIQSLALPSVTPIYEYCLYRILISEKFYENKHWEIGVGRGYYGDEITDVTLNHDSYNKLCEHIKKLNELNDNQRIEYVLIEEYGYLLETIKNIDWQIKKIFVKDIVISQEVYVKKVENNIYDKTYKLPIGIYLKDVRGYKIIDGYHRYVSLSKGVRSNKQFEIICPKE